MPNARIPLAQNCLSKWSPVLLSRCVVERLYVWVERSQHWARCCLLCMSRISVMHACLTAIGQDESDRPCNCAKPPIDSIFRVRRGSRDPRCHQAEIYGMNHRGETEGTSKQQTRYMVHVPQQRKYRDCHQAQPTTMIVLSANKARCTKSVPFPYGLNKDHKAIVLKLA